MIPLNADFVLKNLLHNTLKSLISLTTKGNYFFSREDHLKSFTIWSIYLKTNGS